MNTNQPHLHVVCEQMGSRDAGRQKCTLRSEVFTSVMAAQKGSLMYRPWLMSGLISLLGIALELAGHLKEWPHAVMIGVGVLAVVLIALTWPGRREGGSRLDRSESSFIHGDASGSTVLGNDSDGKYFIDGNAKNAIILNNSHLHKWWSLLMAWLKSRGK
jgi:hypothetical protein